MSLCQSLIANIEEMAGPQGFSRVRRVRLVMGMLSHVEPEAIRFCFDVVARATMVEGAVLEIERPAGQVWCTACSRAAEIESRDQLCPHCGSGQWVLTGGEQMRLAELEVE